MNVTWLVLAEPGGLVLDRVEAECLLDAARLAAVMFGTRTIRVQSEISWEITRAEQSVRRRVVEDEDDDSA